MYILKNISLNSRFRIRKDSMRNVFDDLRERFLPSNSRYKKRAFHMESNNLGWSLKEGKRDAPRKKRRFIIRHVCTLRQSLPTGLVKKYTLDQWGRDTLLILPPVTFLSLLVIIGDIKHTCMKDFTFHFRLFLKTCFFVYSIFFVLKEEESRDFKDIRSNNKLGILEFLRIS